MDYILSVHVIVLHFGVGIQPYLQSGLYSALGLGLFVNLWSMKLCFELHV